MKRQLSLLLPLVACFVFVASASARAGAEPIPQAEIKVVAEKELLIRDPAVVDSAATEYPGFLSIGFLFDELSESGQGADLMRNWLELWMQDQTINGHVVAARPQVYEKVILPWQRRDGWVPARDGEWRPDLANAPFRLLAVVNRIDLSSEGRAVLYGGGRTGESLAQGRLVFAVLGEDGEPLGRHFTVILEYEVPIPPKKIGPYAGQWHRLGELEFQDERFLEQLERVTRTFTADTRDKNGKWVRPPLAQLRTNDMALDEVCELREFKLSKGGALLRPVALPHTPAAIFLRNGSRFNRILGAFIAENSDDVRDGKIFPASLPAPTGSKRLPVLAGSALIPDSGFHWKSNRITDGATRHNFSMRTCSGCHAGDTNTEFCHISPRRRGEPSELSKFLRMNGEPFTIDDPGHRRREVGSAEMAGRISSYRGMLREKVKK